VSGLRFFFTGEAFLARAEELIRGARDYILVDSYLVSEDEKGKYVFELLKQRQRDKVRVYVLTDPSSGFVPARTGVPYLAENGLPVAEFNPIRGSRLARLPLFLYRDHRKFLLVDGETAVLGGQNLWSISLDPPDLGGNTDAMVEFRSAEACRELLSAYIRQWNAYSMDKLRVEDFPVRETPSRDEARAWLVHQDGRAAVGDMFDRLLALAREEVWLLQDSTLPDGEMLERIRRLTAAGVRVNIMFSQVYSSMNKFHYCTGYRKLDLIRAGARLWEFGHPLSHLHYKAVIVDGRWFPIGSANFTFRSVWRSKELNLAFEGRELGRPVMENLDFLASRCHPITVEQASKYRGAKYLFYYLLLFMAG